MKQVLPILAGFSLFVAVTWAAQQQNPNPPRPPTSQRPPTQSQSMESVQRIFFLTGRIVMADGSPIPDFVQVEMLCNGRVLRQTHAARDGAFSFEMGSNRQSDVMDASASGPGSYPPGMGSFDQRAGNASGASGLMSAGLGRVDLSGCEVLISTLPDYQSDSISLGRISVFDSNIGVIYMRPLEGVKGTTVSTKTLMAPRAAVKEFEKGRKELSRKKVDLQKARNELEKAVELYAGFSEAWNLLGEVRAAENDLSGAHQAFEKAIAIEPTYVSPYLSLTRLELQQSRWAEAVKLSDRVIELNPYLLQGRYFHALSHFQAGSYEAAEKSIRSLQEGAYAKTFPMLHYLLGGILARRGEFAAAAGELNRFLGIATSPAAAEFTDNVRKQLADWERQGLIKSDSAPPPD